MKIIDKILTYFKLMRTNTPINNIRTVVINKKAISLNISYSISKREIESFKLKNKDEIFDFISKRVTYQFAESLMKDGFIQMNELPETYLTKEYMFTLWMTK
jgi:hypothetical protein